jgi:type VII secretion effector (TIGR04197 family)
MRKHILTCISLLLILSILTISLGTGKTAFVRAETTAQGVDKAGETGPKEEVIYALLDDGGEVRQIYAVNILNITAEGPVTDYGSYSSLKNLTTLEDIANNGTSVTFAAPAGRFYYQGSLANNNLPWNIHTAYFLDNTEISAKELAGRSGRLEIRLTTEQNTSVEPSFYDNYLLQAAITLDTDRCGGITAPGATLTNAGTDKIITYTVMPGNEGNISISADVKDFEMEGIQITAVPFSMNFDLPDTSGFAGDLLLLSEAIQQLSDGISSVRDGVSELAGGSAGLKAGSFEFKTGLDRLDSKSEELVSASEEISGALAGISEMLGSTVPGGDLSSLEKLPSALTALSSGLDEIAGGLSELKTGFLDAYGALEAAVAAIPDAEISQEDLQSLMGNNPNNTALNRLIDSYTAARTVKGTWQMVSPAFVAVKDNLGTMNESVTAISSSLDQIAAQLTSSFEGTDLTAAVAQLSSGISQLAANYESFHTGLSGYTGGISQLASAYGTLDAGISGLAEGAGELSSGAEELSEGADELNTQLKPLPDQIDSAIDELLSDYDTSGFTPVSFVSEQNNKVASVQFVLKTDGIKKAEVPEEADAETETGNFWTRLKALFTGR